MKKLLLCLLLPFALHSQIVNIPDAIFKAVLLNSTTSSGVACDENGAYIVVDTNQDGQIQNSEALQVKQLWLGNNYLTDLTGIEAFTNLKILYFEQNNVSVFNPAPLVNLTELYCSQNALTSLDLSTLTNLTKLECGNNPGLGSLDVSMLTQLTLLKCWYNGLTSLNVAPLTNLTYLDCGQNQISTLNVSPLTNLQYLYCGANNLSSLDLTYNTQLQVLDIVNDPITSLNTSSLANLQKLYAWNSQLASLNLAANTNLQELNITNTPITTVDVSMLGNLIVLGCGGPQFTGIDVTNLPNLTNLGILQSNQTALDLSNSENLVELTVEYTGIQQIDISNAPELWRLQVRNNPDLEYLNMKNGNINFNMFIENCPQLITVCADEENIPWISGFFQLNPFDGQPMHGNHPDGQVNTYCSFTPGGAFNTITGSVRFDGDNNGCSGSDMALPMVKVGINDGTTQGAAFSGQAGDYTIYVQKPDIVLTPQLENPAYFNVSPATTSLNFPSNNNTTQTQNFCLTANGVHPDAEVIIVPIQPARPGFDAVYKVVLSNKGNQTLSGTVNFAFEDDVLDYVSSAPAIDVQSANNLGWNYSGLLPFQNKEYTVTLNVNAPTETPAVNIDDVLHFSAVAEPVSGDETAGDNQFAYDQVVVGSFDPNDKVCLQGSIVSPTLIGDYLHYVINFENTGTFPAEKVVIKDQIDGDKFEVSSFQVISASHAHIPVQLGNKIEFHFQDINLMPNAYGYVAFKIRTKNQLTAGTTVSNKASIYFDFNFPINTNTVHTTFQALGVNESSFDDSVVLFPNPAGSSINIKADTEIQSVRLYDTQGRNIANHFSNDRLVVLDVSSFASGIYYLEIMTVQGLKREKLLKN